MVNNYGNIDIDDEDDDLDTPDYPQFDDGSDLVKKLRKAKRSDEKRIKELTEQLEGITKSQRERLVKEVLEKQGVNLKVAQFIPQDLEASEDAVSQWLESNGDVFGYEPAPRQTVSQDDVNAMRKMNSVLTGASTPDTSTDLEMRLNAAQTTEEVLNILAGQ